MTKEEYLKGLKERIEVFKKVLAETEKLKDGAINFLKTVSEKEETKWNRKALEAQVNENHFLIEMLKKVIKDKERLIRENEN